MFRIDFERPLTALEVRDPVVDACRTVASEFSLYAKFDQGQQAAFSGYNNISRLSNAPKRVRIGNGKHKSWAIHFQTDPTNISRPNVVGILVIQSLIKPEIMQFGGFDYGKHVEGEKDPTYSFATFHTPSELGLYRPIDPTAEIMARAQEEITEIFSQGQGQLFPIASILEMPSN